MRALIEKDLYRYLGDESKNFWLRVRYFWFTPVFSYICLFRKAQASRNRISRFFYTCLLKYYSLKLGIQIPATTKIGEGLRIAHFGTIVVNPYAVIGNNFTIAQGCLIGNSKGRHFGVPTIGNNVCMHANSMVVGGVTIGDDVLIAPGAFVNFDVPSNSIVIGNPGKIIPQQSSPTEKYIIFKV